MQSLLFRLAALADRPLGTLVHVGCGRSGPVHREAGLQPERLVLVEGDPEIGEELARELAGRAGVAVHTAALAPAAGEVAWHRYNLAALNGPQDAESLRPLYPRLRRLSTLPRRALGIADFLAGIPASTAGHLDVLVLDVPGQELALSEAIPDDALHRFRWVVLRGCREAGFGAGGSAGRESLARRGYRIVEQDEDSEPLWPVALLQLDAETLLRKRVREMEVVVAQARSASAEASAHLDAERAILEQTRQELSAARAAEATARQQVASLSADPSRLEERRAELDRLRAEAHGLEDRLQQMTRARDEHRQWHLENEKWAKGLKAENERLQEELAARRDAETQLLKQVESLKASELASAAKLRERDGRQHLLDRELLKAEAQLELIKDVLIREKNF